LVDILVVMLQSVMSSLGSYLAAHVLLCLVPAFLIAGAMTALILKETIACYVASDARKYASYPIAAVGGFVLAVCSCTILPLIAGTHRKGAGLGPAINILVVTCTGVAIGMDVATARVALSIVFGISVGLIMPGLFYRDDQGHSETINNGHMFVGQGSVRRVIIVFMYIPTLVEVPIANMFLDLGMHRGSLLA